MRSSLPTDTYIRSSACGLQRGRRERWQPVAPFQKKLETCVPIVSGKRLRMVCLDNICQLVTQKTGCLATLHFYCLAEPHVYCLDKSHSISAPSFAACYSCSLQHFFIIILNKKMSINSKTCDIRTSIGLCLSRKGVLSGCYGHTPPVW